MDTQNTQLQAPANSTQRPPVTWRITWPSMPKDAPQLMKFFDGDAPKVKLFALFMLMLPRLLLYASMPLAILTKVVGLW